MRVSTSFGQAEQLPKVIHARVLKLVERLAKWPAVSGAKALSGNLAGWGRGVRGAIREAEKELASSVRRRSAANRRSAVAIQGAQQHGHVRQLLARRPLRRLLRRRQPR